MNGHFGDEFLVQNRPDIWRRLSRWMWLLLFLLLAAAAVLLILPEQKDRDSKRANISSLKARIAEQEKELEQMRESIRLVREDRGYFEMVARDKLRLGKDGEHIVRIAKPATPESPAAQTQSPQDP